MLLLENKRFFARTLNMVLFLVLASSVAADNDERNLDYILDRHLDAAGGRLGFSELQSLRVNGTITFEDGIVRHFIAIKKHPNFYRITVDYTTHRVTQSYDGEQAWWMVEMPGKVNSGLLEGKAAVDFIREAPILNPLIDPDRRGSTLALENPESAEDVYAIRVEFPDGWKSVYMIDKESFREKRVIHLDKDNKIIDMVVPLKFEFIEGILFITEVNRFRDGRIINSLSMESIELNLGVLDSVFSMPEPESDS